MQPFSLSPGGRVGLVRTAGAFVSGDPTGSGPISNIGGSEGSLSKSKSSRPGGRVGSSSGISGSSPGCGSAGLGGRVGEPAVTSRGATV